MLDDKNRWKILIGTSSRMQRLQQRQVIISAIRDHLYTKNFLEIETPILVKNTTPDTFIDSIEADNGYLIASTEYQIKRLIAGGFEKIFTLTKNFRANDRGAYHNTEFTMLEWGRAFETLNTIEKDATQLIRQAFCALYPTQNTLTFNGNEINFMTSSWERLTVREAFNLYLGLNHLDNFSLKNLCLASKEAGILLPTDFQNDQSLVMSFLLDLLQSHLGKETPTFLYEWPQFLSSSAPLNASDSYTTERSELYIGGIEIANGFPFLRDFQQQKDLFDEQIAKRKELGKPIVLVDKKYLEALKYLPNGAGMALGIDRLVMILTGATKLADVQAFDWDEL